MKLVIEDDVDALSRTTAAVVAAAMLHDRRVNLSLTAGATPAGTYRLLAPLLAARTGLLGDVHFYNFDEIPVTGAARGITLSALHEQLYDPAGIPAANIHPLDPADPDATRADLRAHGGLDLVLMGLGADCHFCGNMPGTTVFDQDIYTYAPRPDLPWYHQVEEMGNPSTIVTFGAPMILSARQAVLIVSGAGKAEALAETLTGPIGTDRPATVLRTHPDLLVIADRAAAALLEAGPQGVRRR